MQKVVVESHFFGLSPSKKTDDSGKGQNDIRMRGDRPIQVPSITELEHFSDWNVPLPVAPKQQSRENGKTGDQRKQNPGSRNPSQLGQPDKVIEAHRIKSDRRCPSTREQGLPRAHHGDLYRLRRTFAHAHLFLIASEKLNPEINPQPQDHDNESLRNNVQMANRHCRHPETNHNAGQ